MPSPRFDATGAGAGSTPAARARPRAAHAVRTTGSPVARSATDRRALRPTRPASSGAGNTAGRREAALRASQVPGHLGLRLPVTSRRRQPRRPMPAPGACTRSPKAPFSGDMTDQMSSRRVLRPATQTCRKANVSLRWTRRLTNRLFASLGLLGPLAQRTPPGVSNTMRARTPIHKYGTPL